MMKKVLVSLLTGLLLLTAIGTVHSANLTQTQVSQLYVSIFGRASEGEGNAYWCTTQSDITIAANTMLATGAAQSYFGATLNDNQAFIEFIYENTLGKTYAEDPDGVNYWVDELSNGKSKGKVIATLINAAMDPQWTGLAAQDQFINKVAVCNYTALTIATVPDVNDLSAFVGFIENVTDNPTTVNASKALIEEQSGSTQKDNSTTINGYTFNEDSAEITNPWFLMTAGETEIFKWASTGDTMQMTPVGPEMVYGINCLRWKGGSHDWWLAQDTAGNIHVLRHNTDEVNSDDDIPNFFLVANPDVERQWSWQMDSFGPVLYEVLDDAATVGNESIAIYNNCLIISEGRIGDAWQTMYLKKGIGYVAHEERSRPNDSLIRIQ